MDKERFKEIISKLDALELNDDFVHEKYWKEEIAVLTEDVDGTIEYLKNDCTENEYSWISEVIDDIIEATKSKELLECYRGLREKYPEACKAYNIDRIIKYAEPFAEEQ